MLMDGDEGDGSGGGGVAEAFDHAGAGQAVGAGGAGLFGLDQFAVARAGMVARGDEPVAVGALVDAGDAAALGGGVEDAEDALRAHADAADHPGGQRGVGGVVRDQPAEQAVAGAEARIVALREHQNPGARVGFCFPFSGFCPEVAVGIGAGDAQDQHRRQGARGADLPAFALQQALVGHVGEKAFQLDLGRAFQAEGAGDVALAGLAGIVADEGEDLLGGGHGAHASPPSMAARGRHRENARPASGGRRRRRNRCMQPVCIPYASCTYNSAGRFDAVGAGSAVAGGAIPARAHCEVPAAGA